MTQKNPFDPANSDRFEIWDMLVQRDITAYAKTDWASHRADFLETQFFGIDGGNSANPDQWRSSFSDLEVYGKAWVASSSHMLRNADEARVKADSFAATTLTEIDITGDFAIAHKKFDGAIQFTNGESERLNWQTLYFCRNHNGRWWITGFLGYLPNPMGA